MRRDRKKKADLSEENYALLEDTIRELCAQGRLLEEKKAMQHGYTSVYQHSVHVAYTSLLYAQNLSCSIDKRSLVRGALMHEYFLYDWHEKNGGHRLHGFRHAGFALRNANRDYKLSRKEKNIIGRHMFPLTVIPPRYLEAWIVCVADKYCAVMETMDERIYTVMP
ncbi:MAG: HD domain-containing protein [Lachnospiraceae bacterium]|nr:HD domain-containing protein [Lachnospiraceae bacterium]